ncbi:winged helix-turn-helix transcriptional regulator [Gordonia sp. TBRC 11910]|uniref:Winged helix-turn-helix transcriptional regulator n=1 Tax=Gordonia asplenii TaxID=2725283 RepID=A0A848KMX7_9ACTN|nr:MarR family winged helix-turn-helix transcriptional regulator [Gordonia asplenii]NMO00026.1 winged helix-turn-helix transcriptional regulator [Gordonia asplenii]
MNDDERAIWPSPLYADLVDEIRRLGRRKATHYAGAQLDGSAFSILLVLSDGRSRTLRELSLELELEQSTINRQVNAAIKRGYLERYDVPGQVSRLIRPTVLGAQAFHDDGMLRVDRFNRIFDDLSPGTPEALLRELRAYNDAYDRAVDHEAR